MFFDVSMGSQPRHLDIADCILKIYRIATHAISKESRCYVPVLRTRLPRQLSGA